jgi:anionic cell wall polymer biosynthesis LytR-Cps2A-Psr (LCP) family protein
MGVVLAVYTLRSNPVDDALASNRVINILFVIEEDKMPLSTYVLMYFPATKRAAIFDVPGDLYLLIKRINRYDRIDKVYEPGRIGNFEREVEALLEIEINFSVVITKEHLTSLVDLLEGVEIFIPSPVLSREGDTLIMFPSGMTVLDGSKAVVYATYSLPDEERETVSARRQRFFMGLLDRFIKMNDSLKNPAVSKLFYSFFRTSLNQHTMMRLFDEFTFIDTERTNIQAVGGSLREVSGEMLLFPLWDGNLIKEVVRQTLATLSRQDEGSGQRTPTVEIFNGTAITGQAGRTAEIIRSFGFDIVSVGNADRNNYESTVIIHRSADEAMVQNFADIIRCKNIINEFESLGMDPGSVSESDLNNFDIKADITLIIGRNFDGRYVIGN